MKPFLTAVAALSLLCTSSVFAEDASELAKAKNCMACHSVDTKLVGPSYKDVAEKYAGEDDAVSHLAKSIKEGSSGTWGPVPMPPNAVSDEEAEALATWITGLE